MARTRKPATCHPDKLARARGLCDACYQRALYWEDPERGRESGRKSTQRARAKRKQQEDRVAVVAYLEHEGVIHWRDEQQRENIMNSLKEAT